ncbi:hypothetical protein K3G63_03305 [Hymenobacter sp. HSC-4F20]|uniref:hypothetical protein n=1 Tax=Hymenobacter sp. HSC-4F20 TaxID=2864135 RepID=UPI001C7338D7|nr:hypothetical protein [Hymenobacter sp. HSC-4F20]MBX0289446.1 hypothetical protein [Hymenobacter sp. HSC-4F20]
MNALLGGFIFLVTLFGILALGLLLVVAYRSRKSPPKLGILFTAVILLAGLVFWEEGVYYLLLMQVLPVVIICWLFARNLPVKSRQTFVRSLLILVVVAFFGWANHLGAVLLLSVGYGYYWWKQLPDLPQEPSVLGSQPLTSTEGNEQREVQSQGTNFSAENSAGGNKPSRVIEEG